SVSAFYQVIMLYCVLLSTLMVSFVAAQPHEIELECQAEGRFPHPGDCGSFVDCTPVEDGDFLLKTRSCGGRAFHPTMKKCVDLEKVAGCKPRAPKALQSDPKLKHICEGVDGDFVCGDCVTLVNCIDGTAYPEPCEHDTMCAIKNTFAGGVCYPQEPLECTCEKPNVFHKDYYSISKFFFCETEGSKPQVHACPEGMRFDDEKRQCANINGLPACNTIGVFANEKDCTEYYTCIFATDGWVQKPFSCSNETSDHLMYNEVSGQCEDPCDWKAEEFTCSSEGRFSDPTDCSKYYECISDPAVTAGEEVPGVPEFISTHHECPEDYVWNQTVKNGFGHCVPSDAESCKPIVSNSCSVPAEWCEAVEE
ncbi:unnamed protein product, partial [Meganyctiphanes norvegica]